MPIPTFTGTGPNPTFEDIVRKVNTLVNELRNLMLDMDSVNIFEVGGWLVTADELASQDGDVGMSTAGTVGTSIRFWAGNAIPASAPYRVLQNGKMIATDGEFTGAITGSTITGGTIQTATSGNRVVITGNIITVYDSSGVKSITIDSTSAPPKINYYDASGVLIASIVRSGVTLLISSENGLSIADNTSMTVGTGSVPLNILGTVKIRSGTALDTITQLGTSGATLPELESQVNTIIQNLRAMNIYAT